VTVSPRRSTLALLATSAGSTTTSNNGPVQFTSAGISSTGQDTA
jgi:hypothetical protein